MAFPIPVPLINGNRYSFASIEVRFAGRRYVGLKSINYKSSQKRGRVGGTTVQKIGRTRGTYTPDGSFEILRAEWQDLIDFLMLQNAAQAPFVGIHDCVFDIDVQFAEEGSQVTQDVLHSCVIDEIDCSNADGTDPSMMKNTLDIMSIDFGNQPSVGAISNFGL